MPKMKNILIFILVAAVIAAVYIFFFKKPAQESGSALVSTAGSAALPLTPAVGNASAGNVTQDFLNLLLSVKEIKLDDSIFKDIAFQSLDGTHSITLTPDGTEGRPNPFAPIGSDIVTPPPSARALPNSSDASGTTPSPAPARP